MTKPISHILNDMNAAGLLTEPMKTALVLGYNVGRVQGSVFYANVRGPDRRPAYVAEIMCAIADSVMQLRVLAQTYGFDFPMLTHMGEDRLYARIEDIAKGRLPVPAEEAARQ